MTGRGFDAAKVNRLTADWARSPVAPNTDVRHAWPTMLARARDLYNNTSHVKGYIAHRLPAQVLGRHGLTMNPRIERTRGSGLNTKANRWIKDAWDAWGELGVCTMCGKYSWRDVQKLALEALARDGEVLIRFVRGRNAGPFNFALQILEAEHLDPTYDGRTTGGLIVMGVEVNKWRRPIGYHVLVENPGDLSFQFQSFKRERLDARDLLHAFVSMYPSQIRGISWLHAAAGDARMMAKYREAELVAARIAASKAAALEATDAEVAQPIHGHTAVKDSEGNVAYDLKEAIEPGQTVAAPPGWKWSTIDPTHPNDAFGDFEKSILRGIASSLGATYHGFANDLSDVNYSSARQGALDEREVWRQLQEWFVDHVVRPVFKAWLDMAMLTPELRIPPQLTPQIVRGVHWRGRGYGWVDPQKEAAAAKLELEAGLTTRTEILGARGLDFQEVAQELAEEQALLEELGIGQSPPQDDSTKPDEAGGDEPDDDDEGSDDDPDAS